MRCHKLSKIKIINYPKVRNHTYAWKKIKSNWLLFPNSITCIEYRFYITYNEENVGLHHMALFTFEHDPTYHTKTYISFKLNTNRYKTEQGGGHIDLDASIEGLNKIKSSGSQSPRKKIVIEVDRRRLYLNDLMNLDQYKRVMFA